MTRAFAEENSRPGVTSQEITTKIKAMVEEAKARYIIDHIDWNTQALPQDLIETEYGPRANGFAGETQFDLVTTAQLSGSRKRKSTEAAPLNTNPARPNKKKPNSLADRISKTHISKPQSVTTKSKFGDLEKRRQRFDVGNNGMGTTVQLQSPINDYTATNDDGPIVGTSEKLEKNFLRLTSAPNPAQVRSLPTLQLTLHFLINRWRDDHNYAYTCDQFKSLRQDLTVQHIKSEFTVRVYEAHARIALEQSDMGEYNQCQTQLTALYKENVPGCCGEFLAYRILYSLFTRDRASIGNLLADLTSADKRHAAVIHALQVRKALAAGNYHQYFKLYDDAPNMGGYLMDKSIDRERLAALARICKGFVYSPCGLFSADMSTGTSSFLLHLLAQSSHSRARKIVLNSSATMAVRSCWNRSMMGFVSCVLMLDKYSGDDREADGHCAVSLLWVCKSCEHLHTDR